MLITVNAICQVPSMVGYSFAYSFSVLNQSKHQVLPKDLYAIKCVAKPFNCIFLRGFIIDMSSYRYYNSNPISDDYRSNLNTPPPFSQRQMSGDSIINIGESLINDNVQGHITSNILDDLFMPFDPNLSQINQVPLTTTNDWNENQSIIRTNELVSNTTHQPFDDNEHMESSEFTNLDGLVVLKEQSQNNEPSPTLDEFVQRGHELNNQPDPIVEEPDQAVSNDKQTSKITDKKILNKKKRSSQRQQKTAREKQLMAAQVSPFCAPENISITNEDILQISTNGNSFFIHPLKPNMRLRFVQDVSVEGKKATKSYLKDIFSSKNLCVGPLSNFPGQYVQLTLLVKLPLGQYALSPYKLFDPDASVDKKFSNVVYRPVKIDKQNDCVRFDVKIARTRQADLECNRESNNVYIRARNPKSAITHLTGITKEENVTPRKMVEHYGLKNACIVVRSAERRSNGEFSVDQNSAMIMSNCFTAVDSNYSEKIPNYSEYRLRIEAWTFANGNDLFNQCTIQFFLKIPEMYHCVLKSNRLELKVALMTDKTLSTLYQIGSKGVLQNPILFSIFSDIINLTFPIVRTTSLGVQYNQRRFRLQHLTPRQLNNPVIQDRKRLCVQFSLQNVNNSINSLISYEHSVVSSVEFYEVDDDLESITENCHVQTQIYEQVRSSSDIEQNLCNKRSDGEHQTTIGLPVYKKAKTSTECRTGPSNIENPYDEMEIFIEMNKDKRITLKVRPRDTVESVKIKIQEHEGILVEDQRLIFTPRRLENDKQLRFYNIQNGSVLGLKPNLRGG